MKIENLFILLPLILIVCICCTTNRPVIRKERANKVFYFSNIVTKDFEHPIDPHYIIPEAELYKYQRYDKAFYDAIGLVTKVENYEESQLVSTIYYFYFDNYKLKKYIFEVKTGEKYSWEYDEKGKVLKEKRKE